MSDEFPAGDALDHALEAAFGGERGQVRMAAALVAYDRVLGRIFDDDADRASWRLARADWALCDADAEEGVVRGDTWLMRVVRDGALEPGVAEQALLSRIGLWELWPGQPPLARCRLSGVTVRLVDPDVSFAASDEGPLAVWDARILMSEDGGLLCRAPLKLPLSALDVVAPPPRPGDAPIRLPRVRASLLRWRRAHRKRGFQLAPA